MTISPIGIQNTSRSSFDELIRSPQAFPNRTSQTPVASTNLTESGQKNNTAKKVGAGVVGMALLATGLGLAYKYKLFTPQKEVDGIFATALNTTKKVLNTAGEYVHDGAVAVKNKTVELYNSVKNFFTGSSTSSTAKEVASEIVEDGVENLGERAVTAVAGRVTGSAAGAAEGVAEGAAASAAKTGVTGATEGAASGTASGVAAGAVGGAAAGAATDAGIVTIDITEGVVGETSSSIVDSAINAAKGVAGKVGEVVEDAAKVVGDTADSAIDELANF